MNRMKSTSIDIARFGRRLGTRSEGASARREIVAALERLPDDGQLTLSLHGVDVVSGSFADEAIGKTCQLLTSGAYGNRTLIVTSPSADLTEDLSDKLAQRKLAVLCHVEDAAPPWRVLGQLADPLVETLHLLMERKSATTKELAESLGIAANACHNRVRHLVALHLIREERVGISAPNTQYRFHSITA
ncbi:MAG: winged helix-turn-helix transcriptional regulator [Candidatus Bipolaricaulia bacterium]